MYFSIPICYLQLIKKGSYVYEFIRNDKVIFIALLNKNKLLPKSCTARIS